MRLSKKRIIKHTGINKTYYTVESRFWCVLWWEWYPCKKYEPPNFIGTTVVFSSEVQAREYLKNKNRTEIRMKKEGAARKTFNIPYEE